MLVSLLATSLQLVPKKKKTHDPDDPVVYTTNCDGAPVASPPGISLSAAIRVPVISGLLIFTLPLSARMYMLPTLYSMRARAPRPACIHAEASHS